MTKIKKEIKKLLPELRKIGKVFEQEVLKKTRTPDAFDWYEFLDWLKKHE